MTIINREKRIYGQEFVLWQWGDGHQDWIRVVRPSRFTAGHGLSRWQWGTVEVDCPFCTDTHIHGWTPGPRETHCVPYRMVVQPGERRRYYIDCGEEDPGDYQRWLEWQQEIGAVKANRMAEETI